MIVTGATAAFALLVVWIVVPAVNRRDQRETRRWAAAEGVRLDETTEPVVTAYLRTRRDLRQIGAVGGLLVAPAVTAGTGIDLQVPGLVWLLTGYLLGCLSAEVALTRRAGAARRSASLEPRRLLVYVPGGMLATQLGAALVVAGLALVCGWLVTPPNGPFVSGWHLGASPEVLRRGAILAGVLAPLAAAGTIAAQRHIVRRPQPLVEPAHVAVDDAVRSSSVRLLGGTGIAVVGVLATAQLSYLAVALEGARGSVAGLASVLVLLLALLQWQFWPYLRWRVRRTSSAPGPSSSPVVQHAGIGGRRG